MKVKIDLDQLSSQKMTFKDYRSQLARDLKNIQKEGGVVSALIVAQYKFPDQSKPAALLVLGDTNSAINSFYKNCKAEYPSSYGMGECKFEESPKGSALHINVAEGKTKLSDLQKGLKVTKLKYPVALSKGGESLSMEAEDSEEDEENPLMQQLSEVASDAAAFLTTTMDSIKALFQKVRDILPRAATGQATPDDQATLLSLQKQMQSWFAAYGNANADAQTQYKDQATKLREQYNKVATLTTKSAAPSPAAATAPQPTRTQAPATKTITGSVGKGGENKVADVKLVQELLNKFNAKLTPDGDCGAKTIAAIEALQRAKFGSADGRIDPNGKTWKLLVAAGNATNTDATKDGKDTGGKMEKPAWVRVAEGEKGVTEIVGNKHNPRILEYHATTGKFSTDEIPWCSSFVNWVMSKAGVSGTGNAMALSWKGWGQNVGKPAYGAVAVFSYGGGKGHVGFVVGKQGNNILVLGGNQGNQVKISSFNPSKVVAYVFPSNYKVPANAYTFGETDGNFEQTDEHNTR